MQLLSSFCICMCVIVMEVAYRHDANFTLSRLDDSWAVGPYQAGARLLLQPPLDLDHVMLGDACNSDN